jgi:hypothetical protein
VFRNYKHAKVKNNNDWKGYMNLFVTDYNPTLAAQHLDDIRLNKMITESCQMIVIALAQNGLPSTLMPLTKLGKPYKVTGHLNHPVTKWTSRSQTNFLWHATYLGSMLQEYHHRTGKNRAGIDIYDLAINHYKLLPTHPEDIIQITHANCSYYSDNNIQDIVYCYRLTMGDKWAKDKIKVKWTKREPPKWCNIETIKIGETYYRFTEKEKYDFERTILG